MLLAKDTSSFHFQETEGSINFSHIYSDILLSFNAKIISKKVDFENSWYKSILWILTKFSFSEHPATAKCEPVIVLFVGSGWTCLLLS